MFGYVTPSIPLLRVREHELYRAAYCGLCRSMGRCTGCTSALSLSYDFVFLALLRTVLERAPVTLEHRRCAVHPVQKRPMMALSAPLETSARAAAVLLLGKVEDDLHDGTGGERRRAALLSPFAKHAAKRANVPALSALIRAHLARLSEIEGEKVASIDAPAQVFGELLGDVFAYGLADEKIVRIAREIGLRTGRFIYVTDALDDAEKDAKRDSYNPILLSYGAVPTARETAELEVAMMQELEKLRTAVSLVDFAGYPIIEEIVQNIICAGMPERFREAAKKYKQTERIETTA